MKYNHYSFDLWLTLIKSNPEFKHKRSEYFFEHFNRQNFSLEQVISIIRDIDDMCNSVNETTGFSINALEMYSMVLYKMGYPINKTGQDELISIYHNCQQIMDFYPPVLFDENTLPTLKKLKESGKTLSIMSNTGFITGQTLVKHLKRLEIHDLFDFFIFSDELKMSKPNPAVFGVLAYRAFAERRHILHVGDSERADKSDDIDCFLINGDTGKTIKDLLL